MNLFHPPNSGCAGFRAMPRREAIQAGVLGALGLSMGDLFRLQAADKGAMAMESGKKLKARAQSVIQIHLPGGFHQQESFDPKPEAPIDIRGAFGVLKTKTGEILADTFPQLAKVTDKLTLLRSVVGKVPDHSIANYHLFTGYTPTAVIDYPQMGSIVSHELGQRGELPPYVAIPNKNAYGGATGFLSSAYGPFELNADPGAESGYKVRDFSIPKEVSLERFDKRQTARQLVEKRLRALEADPELLGTMDGFYKQAYTMLTSEKAQAAFTLDRVTDADRQLYGSHVTGELKGPDGKYHRKGLAEKLLVARQLVEAGVRFVTVQYGSWDCHVDVKKSTLDQMAPLDAGIAGLITDLDQRGLLESTIVWVTSEFGRTPKINKDSGRDHFARCYSMLVAGGGFIRGQVYGASDSTGAEPMTDALLLEDLLFTIYHQLGIDADKELLAFGTRPIEIVKSGKLVQGLLA
jgi:hypothetical protein